MCAVAALALTACHKEPAQPNGGQDIQIPTGEGIYNPGMHITGVVNDYQTAETWIWQDGKLQSINQDDNCGGYTPINEFEYNGWRMSQMTMYGDLPGTVSYAYTGDKLSGFSITSGGMPVATAEVLHTGDQITHLDLEINDEMLQMALSMLGEGGFPLPFKGGKEGGKLSLTSTEFYADLIWDGDNVSRMELAGQVVMGVTVEEIQQYLPLDSIMGSMVSLLGYLTAGQELPLTITINDTTILEYDNHANPLQGLLGRFDPSILSANNVTMLENRVSAVATLTISLPFIGSHDFSYPLPISRNTALFFTYTYNAAGYPATVEDSDGGTKIYTYQEQ